MSLFSNLLETYEKCFLATGISNIKSNEESDAKKTFLPLFHITFKSHICVVLDGEGNFISIERDKKEQTIIIPCTEDSGSRSSGIAPHALCDRLAYLDKNLDEDKFNAYIEQLGGWKDDNIKLNAIYNFLINNSISDKLMQFSLLKDSEIDERGKIIFDKIAKLGIRFSVEILGDYYPNVWEDKELYDKWISKQIPFSNKLLTDFDYLSGNKLSSVARTFPKNINSITGNAKLLSCNDSSGYTYRGRFDKQDEAIQIDVFSSQKVHQTLKWLINNGYTIDTQVTVIWAIDNENGNVIKPYGNSFDLHNDLFDDMPTPKLDSELIAEAETAIDINYAKKIANVLKGFGSAKKITDHSKKIAIAIFDAATTGRMGIIFYQELPANKYLENIADWHEESAWHLVGFKKEINEKGKEVSKAIPYIGCPSFTDITTAIYGKQRGGADKGYAIIRKRVQKQLLECMFGNFSFPKSFVEMASYRASNPLSFTDNEGSFKEFQWKKSLNITCSLIKKYINQNYKEEISMELEKTRNDRDYLYGRLLAVADKLEKTAHYITDKNGQRATNAIRLMSSFSTKPYSTWEVLWNQLIPYINQLQGATFYQSIIDSIMELFKPGEYEDNKPLSPLYLLGYSAQNRALLTKKEKMEENENDKLEE